MCNWELACGVAACVVLAATNVACGPTAAAGAQLEVRPLVTPWNSGSRLQAITWGSAEEAGLLVGWWDTKLELECGFVMTTEGMRCLPGRVWGSTYGDASCSTPLPRAMCQDEGDLVSLADAEPGEACTMTYTPHRVGKRTQDVWARGLNDECVKHGSSVESRLSTPLSPEDFVEATQSVAIVGDIGVRQAAAVDGSEMRMALTTRSGQDCDITALHLADICVPGPIPAALEFAAASCEGERVAPLDACGSARTLRGYRRLRWARDAADGQRT